MWGILLTFRWTFATNPSPFQLHPPLFFGGSLLRLLHGTNGFAAFANDPLLLSFRVFFSPTVDVLFPLLPPSPRQLLFVPSAKLEFGRLPLPSLGGRPTEGFDKRAEGGGTIA